MSYRNNRIITVLLLTFLTGVGQFSQAQSRDSGGGSGIIIYTLGEPLTPEYIEEVLSTDVYRATYELVKSYKIHIDPIFLVSDKNLDEAAIEKKSVFILEQMLHRIRPFSPPFVAKLMEALPIVKDWTAIPEGQRLPIINDYGPQFEFSESSRMQIAQIIERTTNVLKKDNQLYKKMNAFNRASIKFHELAYAASGHTSSYYVQLLFGFIVSSEIRTMQFGQFRELMQNLFQLEYAAFKTEPAQINLPRGVSLVSDSHINTSTPLQILAQTVDNTYGSGGRTSAFASENAICGEITFINKESHSIDFRYRHENLIAFGGEKFSGYDKETFELDKQQWTTLMELYQKVHDYLQAAFPKYMFPVAVVTRNPRACIIDGNLSSPKIETIEIALVQRISETEEAFNKANLEIEELKFKQEDTDLDRQIDELVAKRDEIPSSNEKLRQRQREYTSEIAELIAKRSARRFINFERAAALSINSMPLVDVETLRTLIFKFHN
jgi:hypothetical protein